jgi:acetyl esterase/lipase
MHLAGHSAGAHLAAAAAADPHGPAIASVLLLSGGFDLDPLFHRLRDARPAPSADLTSAILARLGDPARQVRLVLLTGAISCAAAMILAFLIGYRVSRESVRPAPPQLTLLSGATNPLLSL